MRVWWVALGWAAAEAVVGVKQGYESIALYEDVLVNVNMSTLNTEMGSRERPATPKKQNEDEREDAYSTTSKQRDWENQRRRDSTSSPHIQQQQYSLSIGSNHMLTEEQAPPAVSDEYQPLLRTLTSLHDQSERLQAEDEVERDLEQLIALKNRAELEEVYGIPVIVTFFFLVFSTRIYLNFVIAHPRIHLMFA